MVCLKRSKVLSISLFCIFFISYPLICMGYNNKILVLPFVIHGPKDIQHLGFRIQKDLSSDLRSRGGYIVPPEMINAHEIVLKRPLTRKDIDQISTIFDANWVISGSLTKIGKRISLDFQLYHCPVTKPPFSLFFMEDSLDSLPQAITRASERIFQHIGGVLRILDIKIEGNRRIETDAIMAVIKSKKGDMVDPKRLNEDLRNVYKMGYFRDVIIEKEERPKGAVIVFRVKEKPTISKIRFEGNRHVSDDDLLKECGIREFTILDYGEVKQSIKRLVDFYRLKGYYNVSIKEKIQELPNNEVSLTYEIKEGEKVYIKKITFIGNNTFSDKKLKDVMETGERGFFSWITKSGLLDRKKLDVDIQRLISFYQNNGFIKVKIGEPKIIYERDKGLKITIEIMEGTRYRVRDIKIRGKKKEDLIASPSEILTLLKTRQGQYFNRKILRKDILTLRQFYVDKGYAYAEVIPSTEMDDKRHLVSILFTISKGKKVRFERINITGNVYTRDKVIRRQLRISEQEYFSGEKLRKSIENLHRLGYFEDVEVKMDKGSQDDLMILNIHVKERPTGSFTIGAGYSSFDKAMLMFQIAQNNFLGYGQKLAASGSLGSKTTQFDIRFTEPYFMDRPISAGVDLYNWKREYDEYTKKSTGGGLRSSFPIGFDKEFTRGLASYYYDDSEISEIEDTASIYIKDMAGRNVTSSVTIGIKRDSKDRPWNTTKGSYNKFSIEYAGGLLGGDVYFTKYLLRSGWYVPLFWDTVFFMQGRWGYVEARSGGKLPVYQKFRIGGINTVRGYDYASISPKDPITGDRIGGEKMMVYNFEYRFPLIKEQGLVGLVFFDAGNVLTDDQSWTLTGIRKSIGFGVRWYSAIGPIRIEYGKIIDRRAGEPSGNWEFTIGGLF